VSFLFLNTFLLNGWSLVEKRSSKRGRPSDFSNEYLGERVVIYLSNNERVECNMLESTRYWFKVKASDGRILYINNIILIILIRGMW
jgi:hypothetical protein